MWSPFNVSCQILPSTSEYFLPKFCFGRLHSDVILRHASLHNHNNLVIYKIIIIQYPVASITSLRSRWHNIPDVIKNLRRCSAWSSLKQYPVLPLPLSYIECDLCFELIIINLDLCGWWNWRRYAGNNINSTRPPLTWSPSHIERVETRCFLWKKHTRSAGFEPGTHAWLPMQSGDLSKPHIPFSDLCGGLVFCYWYSRSA